jgi:hypothetical protein
MPDHVGLLADADCLHLPGALRPLEQAEFHLVGVFREEGKVDSAAVPGGSQRIRFTGIYFH